MKQKDRIWLLSVIGVLLILEVFGRTLKIPYFEEFSTILTRVISSVVLVVFIRRMGYRVFRFKPGKYAALTVLFASLVAVNNFPFYTYWTGNVHVTEGALRVLLFALECAAVGCFEELAFRGFLLPYIAEKLKGRPHAPFFAALISSAVFAVVHLVNLLVSPGAAGAVIQQIGYSFLIGGMCACVLYATRSIWLCAAIHAVYNFFGQVLSRLGDRTGWDMPTILITAFLGLSAAAVLITGLLKQKEVDWTKE